MEHSSGTDSLVSVGVCGLVMVVAEEVGVGCKVLTCMSPEQPEWRRKEEACWPLNVEEQSGRRV